MARFEVLHSGPLQAQQPSTVRPTPWNASKYIEVIDSYGFFVAQILINLS